MPTAFVRATYADETALQTFLLKVFGPGTSTVIWKRGRFQCTIPRQMTEGEIEEIKGKIEVEHYEQV